MAGYWYNMLYTHTILGLGFPAKGRDIWWDFVKMVKNIWFARREYKILEGNPAT
jgi:hypothetical protein